MSGKNRAWLPILAMKLLWTAQKCIWQHKLVDISDGLQTLARESANIMMKFMDSQESQMQALDAEFDGDDISTEEYMELNKKRQEIEETCQNEMNVALARVNAREKSDQQMQVSVETRLENANAQLETCDAYLQEIDSAYC